MKYAYQLLVLLVVVGFSVFAGAICYDNTSDRSANVNIREQADKDTKEKLESKSKKILVMQADLKKQKAETDIKMKEIEDIVKEVDIKIISYRSNIAKKMLDKDATIQNKLNNANATVTKSETKTDNINRSVNVGIRY